MAHAGGDLTAKNILVVRDSHTQLVSHVFNPVCAPDLPCRVYLLYLDLGLSPDLLSRIGSTGAFDQSPQRRPNHVILHEVRALLEHGSCYTTTNHRSALTQLSLPISTDAELPELKAVVSARSNGCTSVDG